MESHNLINYQEQRKEDGNREKFSFTNTTRTEKFLLLSFAFVNFGAANCFSLMAPFFPNEALIGLCRINFPLYWRTYIAINKETSQTVIGLIFGTFELTIFLTAPVFGNNLARIGSKFTFISGVFVCSTCTILFGLLDKCPNGTTFIVMCFLVRMTQALGASAFITSTFAIISHEFPKHVTTVIGTLETFSGLGMVVGPGLGSSLYVAGGFGMPFFLIGGIMAICGFITWIAMPTISDTPITKSKSFFVLMKSPFIVIACVITVCGTMGLGFLDPTLQPRLGQLNISTILVGVFFLSTSALYAITAPVWGWLTDTKGLMKPLLIIGNILVGIGYLILGPSPLLPFIPLCVSSTVIGLVLLGIFIGATIVPTYTAFTEGAFKQLGLEDNFDTHGMISGLFNSCWSLGGFIGPMVAGYSVEKFNFDWAATYFSVLFFMAALLLIGYVIVERWSNILSKRVLGSQYELLDAKNNNRTIDDAT